MRLKTCVAIVVALSVFAAGAQAQYSGPGIAPAQAQDAKVPQPKGMKAAPVVGSTGALPRIPMTVPVVLMGQTITLEPGGQTGKMRFLVPSYIYVVEGTLVIDTEGGPIGVSGIQYHGEGQSYAGPPGLWFNAMNTSPQPVRFLQLLLATPGGATTEQAKED
jgi:quercetin dioxygenase-like cupin family protein